MQTTSDKQRLPAEQNFADELERLRNWDPAPVPPGWQMSPLAAEKFIIGNPNQCRHPNYYFAVYPARLLTNW
jgi:hypothetical protein